MSDTPWWFAEQGASHGPLTQSELVEQFRERKLALATLVWQPGMSEWQPISAVPTLKALLHPNRAVDLADTAWHRWFARVWLDYFFASMLVGIAVGIAAPDSGILKNNWAILWIAALIWIPLEAALLSSFGTTPGKFLVGLRVVSSEGEHLSYSQALARALQVWVNGMAFVIPVVLLFTFVGQYKRLKAGKNTSYDESGGYVIVRTPLTAGRRVLLAAVIVVLFGLYVLGKTDP
jgi:uncharacterized RDD family membrane protein YckC